MARQDTYTVKQLRTGTVYRDALSGYLVLVLEKELWERRGASSVKVKRLVGWFWNPVWGKHTEMELHDHQLIGAEQKTSLKPDTRYDQGYHGL